MKHTNTEPLYVEQLKDLRFEVRDGKIAILTINRPQVRNSMPASSWMEFFACLDWIEAHPEIRVLILTGAGDKAFMSGADIVTLKERTPLYQFRTPYSTEGSYRLGLLDIPVIAAVNGYAFGGGFEIALASDIRLASENAKFGFPEPTLGTLPGAGGTQMLARMAGLGVAKDVILGGRVLTAEEARHFGIVMKVVEREKLLDAALELAQTAMKRAPLSLAMSKRLINMAFDVNLAAGMSAEQLAYMALLGTKDKLEGTSAFLEKRPAEFKGE